MNKVWVVAKNELARYFSSPLAYVYLVSFLLLNGSFAIYFGHFFDRGSADLSPMFAYQPWLYLLFIPGISMRLWAEEFRSKTVVQIVTMPVTIAQLVWGKFLASWFFCALALALTFPFVITVNMLGTPDNGVIVSGYLASFVLAGCMLAISQTMSALTKNQVIALVLAVIANLIFFLSGLEYVLSFFRLFAPLPIIDMIASFSFLTHFNTMIAGLLELRDLVFFVSLILLFNFTTVLAVSFRTSGSSRLLQSASRNYYILVFVLLLSGFVGLNLLANNLLRRFQYDFTEEQVFTITDSTRNVLQSIQQPITAKLYYSKILEQRNPALRQMFDKVRILLRQYAFLSEGKFDYRIYDPEMLSEREDQALASGLQPLPIIDMNRNAFFGLSLTDVLDNHEVIPFFAMERFDFLEQDLTAKIYALSHAKKTIGILTPLALFDTMRTDNEVSQKWACIDQLEELYHVRKIETTDDIDGIDALIMIYPRNLTQNVIAKIKDYSDKGGKILLFADVAPEASRLYSPSNNDLLPSDLGGLDAFWGFKFNTDVVAADLSNSITVDATDNYKTNPTFTQDVLQFILKPANFNRQAAETSQLKEILFASAAVIEPLPGDDSVTFIPLMKTSINSQLMPAYAAQRSIAPEVLLQNFKADTTDKVVAAKIISRDEKRPYEVIAVADTDMLYDSFWSRTQLVLDSRYVVPVLDNVNFMMNALESLLGEKINLIGLRGKSSLRRPFEDIEKMRRNNERAYKVGEAEIFRKINKAKEDLQQIWNKKDFEERMNFNADELAVIAGIRKNLEELRLELGKIRTESNAEIKRIDLTVKFFNIYFMPLLLLAGLGGLVLFSRRKRQVRLSAFKLNRPVLLLGAVTLLLLCCGLWSVYRSDVNSAEKIEGKPVFSGLADKINMVEKIVLRSHDHELNFYKKDGVWMLDNPADVPVYQARIRSFLSALLEARYYERKTANAEHLRRFDLNPVAEDGSKNLRIELQSAQGNVIEGFEVGRYDVDIGRGAKAAYIKFDNKFQVWLVAVDFIDLSTDWREWTYSTLWNLRFGRLASVNGSNNAEDIALLMKYILNTELIRQTEVLPCAGTRQAENGDVLLVTEDGSDVRLKFYRCGEKFYVAYEFVKIAENNNLLFLERYAKDKFYEISKDNMEKIRYVLKAERKGSAK